MKGQFLPRRLTKNIKHNQSFQMRKVPLRRGSLPESNTSKSINLRRSFEQPTTDIYFDVSKKSKFMKGIVDGYFNDNFQEILNRKRNDEESDDRQFKAINSSLKGILKKGKKLNPNSHNSQAYAVKKNRSKNNSPTKNNLHNTQMKPTTQSLNFPEPQQLQDTPNYHSAHNFTNSNSFLPPIHEAYQESEDLAKIFPEFQGLASQLNIKDQMENNVLTFQNEAFRIWVHVCGGKAVCRYKQFKPNGYQLMKREERARKSGVEGIWTDSKINSNTFTSQMAQPIKNSICRLITSVEGPNKYKVRNSTFRKYLLANQCLQFKHLIRQICGTLKKIEGRVLNNKVNPANIFVLKGNIVKIGEWAYSSFRDEFDIQQKKFESRINPILRSQQQWLATPQYLSPEILMAIVATCQQQQPDIWENNAASDIWSLGMTLFQILTMIPVWINEPCLLKIKTRKPQARVGVLGTDNRDPHKIMGLQKKFSKIVRRHFEQQIQQQIPDKILYMIERMLAYDPSERITLEQILNILK